MAEGRPLVRNRGDLDYLRGLADRRGDVLVSHLPGLGTPASATLVRMRWKASGKAGELRLEMDGDSELAHILEGAHARHDDLEQLTIFADDRPTGVDLREVAIARIADGGGTGIISVDLRFPSWPRDREP